jgi:hypothetical protein
MHTAHPVHRQESCRLVVLIASAWQDQVPQTARSILAVLLHLHQRSAAHVHAQAL